MMALSSTDYIVSTVDPHSDRWDQPGFEEVYADPRLNIRLLQFKLPLPRFYLAPNVIYNPEPMTYIKILTKDFKDPFSQVEIAADAALIQDENHPSVNPKPYQLAVVLDQPEKKYSGFAHLMNAPTPWLPKVFIQAGRPRWMVLKPRYFWPITGSWESLLKRASMKLFYSIAVNPLKLAWSFRCLDYPSVSS